MKWYKKMAVWQFLIFLITPFAGISEAAIFMTSAHPIWHVVVLGLGGLLAALKYFANDTNANGVVDIFEKKDKK